MAEEKDERFSQKNDNKEQVFKFDRRTLKFIRLSTIALFQL